ncbi:hypothetical protein AALO_G00283870, partial [Alosa alosa]
MSEKNRSGECTVDCMANWSTHKALVKEVNKLLCFRLHAVHASQIEKDGWKELFDQPPTERAEVAIIWRPPAAGAAETGGGSSEAEQKEKAGGKGHVNFHSYADDTQLYAGGKGHVNLHSYADETQLYISVEPTNPDGLCSLTACLTSINQWMSKNFLKLNDDKTEVLLVGPKLKRDIILSNLGNLAHQVKPKVTRLGVILDTELSFKPHISKVTQTAYFHLRNIAKVRPFLTQQDAEKLI